MDRRIEHRTIKMSSPIIPLHIYLCCFIWCTFFSFDIGKHNVIFHTYYLITFLFYSFQIKLSCDVTYPSTCWLLLASKIETMTRNSKETNTMHFITRHPNQFKISLYLLLEI